MAIVVTFTPTAMTAAQYDEVIQRLEAAGADTPPGRLHHVAASDGVNLRVVDVWESPQAFERFGETLVPILQQMGIALPPPEIRQVHNVIGG
jgi:hypothetical protein